MGSGWFWLRWIYFRSLKTQTAVGRGAMGWWSSAREGYQGRFGAPVYFLAVLVGLDMQCISSIDGEGKVRLKGSCAQQMSQDACKRRTLSQMFSRSEGPGTFQRRLSDNWSFSHFSRTGLFFLHVPPSWDLTVQCSAFISSALAPPSQLQHKHEARRLPNSILPHP